MAAKYRGPINGARDLPLPAKRAPEGGLSMRIQPYLDVDRSTDVLNSFAPGFFTDHASYTVVAQDVTEVQDTMSAPALSMGPYLMRYGLMELLPAISIYTRLGYDRAHTRLLYMNAEALRIWKLMDKRPRQIGVQHRPPHSAVLSFGMPFGE
jgi:hypothetical protein